MEYGGAGRVGGQMRVAEETAEMILNHSERHAALDGKAILHSRPVSARIVLQKDRSISLESPADGEVVVYENKEAVAAASEV